MFEEAIKHHFLGENLSFSKAVGYVSDELLLKPPNCNQVGENSQHPERPWG
jgi:hypothetical protein